LTHKIDADIKEEEKRINRPVVEMAKQAKLLLETSIKNVNT